MLRKLISPCLLGLFVLTGLCPTRARADVVLPKILSSHAVLQREQPIHVWGWADPGEQVSVQFDGGNATATTGQFGRWSVWLPPHSAGGPFEMKISAHNQITLDDLLVGDVWFASGQSNMEMPLKGFDGAPVKDGEKEISAAEHPDLRLLLIPKTTSAYALDDFQGDVAWTKCTPQTGANFSAVAYFFGREIAAKEHVPVGLIDSTWGGTPAEAWISMEGLSTDASLMPVFAAYGQLRNEQAKQVDQRAMEKREDEAARKAGQPLPKRNWHPDPASWTPSWLYNGMVAPATGYAIKGAIWYQGESNAGRARAFLYQRLFPALIADWRAQWGSGNFPFFWVQIANYKAGANDEWPVVREAQRRTLALANTGMAVTIDVGQPENIHPADKQAVGARLARAARNVAYGEKLPYSGPMFQRASPEGGALRVWFSGHEGKLVAKGAVRGFEIAGADHKFYPAEGQIEAANVLLKSADVTHPIYARYGWSDAPVVNLFDEAGLPASPFTSEENDRAQ